MYNIDRNTAVRWVAQYDLARMNEAQREDCLCGMWLDPESDAYYMLSDDLKTELATMEDFSEVTHPRWNPIILEYTIYKLEGVSNNYLKKRLLRMGLKDEFQILGSISPDFQTKCDCCEYLVPSSVCPICGWTDTKTESESDYGVKNRGLTLQAAKLNFENTGSCYGEPEHVKRLTWINPERYEQFEKPK